MNRVFYPILPVGPRVGRPLLPIVGAVAMLASFFLSTFDQVLFLGLSLGGLWCLGIGALMTLQTKKIEFLPDHCVEHHYNFMKTTIYYRDVTQIGRVSLHAGSKSLSFYNLVNQHEWEAAIDDLRRSGRLPEHVIDLTKST